MPQQFFGVVDEIDQQEQEEEAEDAGGRGAEELPEQVAREDGHLRSRSLPKTRGKRVTQCSDRQRIHAARESPRAFGAQRKAIIAGPERLSTAPAAAMNR